MRIPERKGLPSRNPPKPGQSHERKMMPKIAKIRCLGKGYLLLSTENPIISSMETVHFAYQNRLKPVMQLPWH